MKPNAIAGRGLWLSLMVTLCLLAVPRAEPQTSVYRPLKKPPEMIQAPLQSPQPNPAYASAEPQTSVYRPLKKNPEMIQAPLQFPQPNPSYAKVTPRLEPIAETKLIMEGLAHTNFRGLERLLTERPNDVKAYQFARGQALMLAETANLLMLRPPKNQGQAVWFERVMALRNVARELGQTMGERDYERGRTGLLKVAAVCNSCHSTFRVPVEIKPFERPPIEKVSVE